MHARGCYGLMSIEVAQVELKLKFYLMNFSKLPTK